MTNTQGRGQQADRQTRRVFLLLPRIDVSVTVLESDHKLIPPAVSFVSAASSSSVVRPLCADVAPGRSKVESIRYSLRNRARAELLLVIRLTRTQSECVL